jgi:hypothetical protein
MEPEEKPPRDEPAVEPEPSMEFAEKLNIPLPNVELLKEAPAEPCPTPPPIPLFLALRASR